MITPSNYSIAIYKMFSQTETSNAHRTVDSGLDRAALTTTVVLRRHSWMHDGGADCILLDCASGCIRACQDLQAFRNEMMARIDRAVHAAKRLASGGAVSGDKTKGKKERRPAVRKGEPNRGAALEVVARHRTTTPSSELRARHCALLLTHSSLVRLRGAHQCRQ